MLLTLILGLADLVLSPVHNRRQPASSRRLSYVPLLETLETRVNPALLLWRPTEMDPNGYYLASNVRNWVDANTGNALAQPPGARDRLQFDRQSTQDCLVDPGLSSGQVGAIDMESYQRTIYLQVSLSVTGQGGSSWLASSIQTYPGLGGNRSLNFSGANVEVWGGSYGFNLSNGSGNNLNVNAGASFTSGAQLTNFGQLALYGAGNIELNNGARIYNAQGAAVTSSSAITIASNAGAIGLVENNGVFTKSGAGTTTTVNADFRNFSGSVQIDSGTLSFVRGERQYGGSTQLNGGSVEGDIYVLGGTLAGVGIINGNVSTANPDDPQAQSTAVIHPGVGTNPGTLTIRRSLRMTAGGTLVIDSNGQGALGRIDLPTPSEQAVLRNVRLIATRDLTWSPADGSYAFLQAPNIDGVLANVMINGNGWTAGPNQPRSFQVQKLNNTSYNLVVVSPNNAPQANADNANVNQGGLVVIAVLDNDNDSDGDPLTITAINGTPIAVGQTITLPSGGLVTLNSDQTLTYSATGSWVQDGFGYTISDGMLQASAGVAVSILS